MIGYLKGTLLNIKQSKIILSVNNIGYEILLPVYLLQTINASKINTEIEVYIYMHQTEKQPKPVLIGFAVPEEKIFFEKFISVDAIGPIKAVNALSEPVNIIAQYIETKNIAKLEKLKGIGKRTAEKIVASLQGTLTEFTFADGQSEGSIEAGEITDNNITSQVLEVLVNQLGYKHLDATQLIKKAMLKKPDITTAEELFDEIFNIR